MLQGRSWKEAFEGNDWNNEQKHVRQRILDSMEWTVTPPVGNGLPSLQHPQTIFPGNRWIPLATMLACHRVSLSPATPPLQPRAHPPPEETRGARSIWHNRLRSSSHHDLPSPAAVLAPRESAAASSFSSIAPAPCLPSAPVPRPASRRLLLLLRARPLLRPQKRARAAAADGA